MKTALEWKKYYLSLEFRENFIYNKDDLGVSCTDSGTSFKLWSPSADSVTLNLYHEGDGGAAYAHIPMKKEDQGVWSSFFDENKSFTKRELDAPKGIYESPAIRVLA